MNRERRRELQEEAKMPKSIKRLKRGIIYGLWGIALVVIVLSVLNPANWIWFVMVLILGPVYDGLTRRR